MTTNVRPFLREIQPGRETLEGGLTMPRHRHFHAYALIVVRGALEQVSYAGRVRLKAGDMVVQPTLDCHSNSTSGVQVLRLPWPEIEDLGGAFALAELDDIVRAAETNADDASELAQASVARRTANAGAQDWPDRLARDLAQGRVRRLRWWARAHGIKAETVSRGFARAYGVGPAQFARELKVRRAWLAISRTQTPFAAIAADSGFADQAHMTRSVKDIIGATPRAWRQPQ